MRSSFFIRNFLHPLLLLLWLAALPACGYKQAVLFPRPTPRAEIRDRYAILLLIDGALPSEVDRLVAAGRLPHFKELFYQDGARFEDALSVLPTVSTPAHQSFISGLFPGHHGIPNLDWFSRPLKKHIDYLKPQDISLTNAYMFNFKQVQSGAVTGDQPHLLYHYLNGHPTLSVFESSNSGATQVLPKRLPLLTAYHGKMEQFYEAFDLRAMQLTLDHFREIPFEQIPRFSYVSCYGMDLIGHFAGPRSARAEDLYLQHDRFLGELKTVLQQRGIWEKTTLIVVSDHGQHELSQTTDLPKLLSKLGLKVDKNHPETLQVVWGDHGTGFSNLYFKMENDWNRPPSLQDLRNYPISPSQNIDLIAAFTAHPEIEFVVAPDTPDRIRVFRKNQSALIERRQISGISQFSYQPAPGDDPLEYRSNPTLRKWIDQGEFHDAEAWLKQSHDQAFPDAVVLLSQLFADYRMGDLALFTVKTSQFKETRLSGHGSMHAEDLNILMMLHGPDIQPGVYPYARSVDLFPTLLTLFQLPIPGLQDGVLRNEIFRDSPPRATTPAIGADMSPEGFRAQIQKKLSDSKLSQIEKEKSLQLLYSLDRFLGETPRLAVQKP